MPDNPLTRRLITIPTVLALFCLVTVLSPLLLIVGVVVDGTRSLGSGKPSTALRSVAFLWLYLLGQVWALACILVTVPLPRKAKLATTFRIQDAWASWNFAALRSVFSLVLEVREGDAAGPGPIIVLSRHASIVDTMLPAQVIAKPSHIRLRYVLKKELLVDPVLDLGGNRLPNHFIDRRSGDKASELEALRLLARDLGPDDGILIYPEGTRYSRAKRDRLSARVGRQGGPIGELAAGYTRVLPPRPGGTLALLEATDADVVVLAHRGLEGLATVRDIWDGAIVGSTVSVAMWRIDRREIPEGRRDRIEWLYRTWAEVDDWIVDPGGNGSR